MKQRPADSSTPGWDLEVTATSDIRKEEEILLSYGDRDNNDFLTHYGFVPPRNPHDNVVLFQNMTDLLAPWQWCTIMALEQHWKQGTRPLPGLNRLVLVCVLLHLHIRMLSISRLDVQGRTTQQQSGCELVPSLPDKQNFRPLSSVPPDHLPAGVLLF